MKESKAWCVSARRSDDLDYLTLACSRYLLQSLQTSRKNEWSNFFGQENFVSSALYLEDTRQVGQRVAPKSRCIGISAGTVGQTLAQISSEVNSLALLGNVISQPSDNSLILNSMWCAVKKIDLQTLLKVDDHFLIVDISTDDFPTSRYSRSYARTRFLNKSATRLVTILVS